jgi:hypothetical protein
MSECVKCGKHLTKRNTGAWRWQYGEPCRCLTCTRKLVAGGPIQILDVSTGRILDVSAGRIVAPREP